MQCTGRNCIPHVKDQKSRVIQAHLRQGAHVCTSEGADYQKRQGLDGVLILSGGLGGVLPEIGLLTLPGEHDFVEGGY